jgi:hypothetical protein
MSRRRYDHGREWHGQKTQNKNIITLVTVISRVGLMLILGFGDGGSHLAYSQIQVDFRHLRIPYVFEMPSLNDNHVEFTAVLLKLFIRTCVAYVRIDIKIECEIRDINELKGLSGK